VVPGRARPRVLCRIRALIEQGGLGGAARARRRLGAGDEFEQALRFRSAAGPQDRVADLPRSSTARSAAEILADIGVVAAEVAVGLLMRGDRVWSYAIRRVLRT